MENALKHYKKRIIFGLIFYGIFSLGIVPIFTLIMGTKDNIITTSMSAMGNSGSGVHVWFIIWTIVFCAYFASFVGYLLMLTKNTHSKIRGFVYFAIAVLIFGNIMPFVPETFPGRAQIHNFCAQISMGIFGTKSITEMSGIILACVFLFCVLIWLYQQDSFDPVSSLQKFDVDTTAEEAEKLEKRAVAAKKEYLKLEEEARHARLKADEALRIAKIQQKQS